MVMISVPQAAQQLGVTPERLYQRINTGSLPAQRVGRQWVIDETDLRRIAHHARAGRPLSATSAWALVAAGEDEALQFSPSARSRARSRRAQLLSEVSAAPDLDVVATVMHRSLGRRAERQLYRASPLDLPALRQDPRLHLSGLSVSAAQMAAGEAVEGYLRAGDLEPLIEDHLLSPTGGDRANVIVHVINGDWDIDGLVVSDLAVAADLAEHDGPRERARAQEIVADLAAGDNQ